MLQPTFPPRDELQRPAFSLADIAVLLGTLALLYTLARIGTDMLVSFRPPDILPGISLDPANLPYYAARSTLRMFVALLWSLTFTLTYGYLAAHSRHAEVILVPLLDILQSIPVLGFLSVTVNGFIALFPGSLLGLEFACIFAIFTGQAWNMTFSFYHSLKTLPRELDEAATLYRLPLWQRFTRLEVPTAMVGLIWNAMMSFGGGWFFIAASESISVLNQHYTLPGLGSYVAAAIAARDLRALGLALLTIGAVIVLIDQLFWKPLVAWADKFKIEQSSASEAPESWLLNMFRAAQWPQLIGEFLAPAGEALDKLLSRLALPLKTPSNTWASNPWFDRFFNALLVFLTVGLLAGGIRFVVNEVGLGEVAYAALLGLATFGRVVLLLGLGTLFWTPIGVAIGFNPRLARLAQPIAQFLASFPANFLFPFATIFFVRTGISLDWGSILLMSLGAQWYILFNTIAGAMSVPTDLREMAANLGLRGWRLWRDLIIPGIFPAWVTGGITASGGAWNASIVSEMVTWGSLTLTANGLGAYVALATAHADWPRIALGVGMMSLYVVGANRLFWRRLYTLAETKYRLT